mmetsp:Transcript_28709/g.67296  ORF Transcript_28709/g.67296 Transcript_28709/m.67296 type:complete len:126 (+) Transcript_28709:1219-1596(+)
MEMQMERARRKGELYESVGSKVFNNFANSNFSQFRVARNEVARVDLSVSGGAAGAGSPPRAQNTDRCPCTASSSGTRQAGVRACPGPVGGADMPGLAEEEEPESERLRRIEWIKYYVRVNEMQQA